MPDRIAALPRNSAGYPIPWFVHNPDGDQNPDFRFVHPLRVVDAMNRRRCWICGQPRGAYCAFAVGPMCVVNRTSAEPPAHRDCAEYSAQVCPFLITPGRERRMAGMPEDRNTAGIMIERNPGVTVVWVTKDWATFKCPRTGGALFSFGEPTSVGWFREGRRATRDEIVESIDSGLPILREIAEQEDWRAVRQLERMHQHALTYLPAL